MAMRLRGPVAAGLLICLLCGLVAGPVPSVRGAATIAALDPPFAGDWAFSTASSLLPDGRVLGGGSVAPGYARSTIARGLSWGGGGRSELAPPAARADASSGASGGNAAGVIVGAGSVDSPVATHALRWDDGVATDLGTLLPDNGGFSSASAVNAGGDIVGVSEVDPPGDFGSQVYRHATLWRGGVPTDLRTLLSDHAGNSMAFGINDAGQVVGWSEAPQLTEFNAHPGHATLWQDGVATDLGTLRPDNTGISAARAINASGRIVGYAQGVDGANHATVWADGAATDLGVPAGFIASLAYAVNGPGAVVGMAQGGGDQANHAYLWRDGVALDLNALLPADSGWVLLEATGINDRGQICGVGVYGGVPRAFLLELGDGPLPSPSPLGSPLPSSSASPSPSPSSGPSTGFADVPADYWAHDQIGTFARRGLTTGCADDDQGRRLYCPERGVTRAEMATFLVRALGQEGQTPPATPTFADVPTNYWAYGAIEAFATLGITTGCGEDLLGRAVFCPERGVTRAEMAAFLVRARGQGQLAAPTPTFADVPKSYWAYGWVERLFALQLTTGCGDDGQGRTVYCPDRGVTRAEMAVFILRAYP